MAEKNIDAEIKKKHEEFDEDIEAYLNQLRGGQSPVTGLSSIVQQIRQSVLKGKQGLLQ